MGFEMPPLKGLRPRYGREGEERYGEEPAFLAG